MGAPVMQWQMITTDPDRTSRFYAELFGWEITAQNALGYRMVDTGSERGITGGIWPAPKDATSFVQLFVEVDDLARTVKQASALGATILVPPQVLPDGDEVAILKDPIGVPLALFRPVPV